MAQKMHPSAHVASCVMGEMIVVLPSTCYSVDARRKATSGLPASVLATILIVRVCVLVGRGGVEIDADDLDHGVGRELPDDRDGAQKDAEDHRTSVAELARQ